MTDETTTRDRDERLVRLPMPRGWNQPPSLPRSTARDRDERLVRYAHLTDDRELLASITVQMASERLAADGILWTDRIDGFMYVPTD
jgi:hypothetical protein